MQRLVERKSKPKNWSRDRRHERQIKDVYMGLGRRGTGEIRTIEIPMPDLDRDYDPSESQEILLDRKLDLDNVEKPDWIEIIPPRKPN